MNRIEQEWKSYEREVLPADCGAIQRSETRRAFYAGVAAHLGLLMKHLEPDPNHEPTEADMRMMDDIAAELREFQAHVAMGLK